MRTLQRSIDVKVDANTIYEHLTRFEDYPQFMGGVQALRQIDDTRLHWATRVGGRTVEWLADITQQEPGRCIGWNHVQRPIESGRLDLRPLGPDHTQVTFTLQAESLDGASPLQESTEDMALRLQLSLERLKEWMEERGAEQGGWRGEIQRGRLMPRGRTLSSGRI